MGRYTKMRLMLLYKCNEDQIGENQEKEVMKQIKKAKNQINSLREYYS